MIDDSWYERPPDTCERVTAGGVVARLKGPLLLVALAREADYPEYVLPKGGVEAGETIDQAAIREVQEETGFTDLTLLGKLGILERLTFNRELWTVSHMFLMTAPQEGGMPPDPHHPHPAIWFDLEKLPSMLFPDQQRFLKTREPTIRRMLAAGAL